MYVIDWQVLYLQAFVFVLLLGQLSRKVFFGQLRPAETEVTLIEQYSWHTQIFSRDKGTEVHTT